MRAGYEARYQATALVHTIVPTHYRGLTRMYLRWDRSDIRESLAAIFRPPRRTGWRALATPIAIAHVIGTLISVPLAFVSAWALLVLLATHPLVALVGLGSLGLPSLMAMAQCLDSEWSLDSLWLIAYAYFAPAILWVRPWAALTLRDQAWMSRRLPQPAAVRAAA